MRLSLPTLLLCAILLCTTAWSQTAGGPVHPEDPAAEFLGTMKLHVSLQSEVESERSTLSDDLRNIAGNIAVFRSEGRIDYCIDAESIQVIGEGGWLDGVATKLLFDLIARTAILQGITEGYSVCPSACSQSAASRVYADACVKRSGNGSSTKLTRCDPNSTASSMREYSVCCPLGLPVPVITMLRSTGVPCDQGGNCESTNP